MFSSSHFQPCSQCGSDLKVRIFLSFIISIKTLAIKLTLRKVETVFTDCNYGLTCGEKCPWEFSPQFIHKASLLWWNIYYVILDNYCLFVFVFLSPQIMIQRGSVFKTCCLQLKNHRLAYLFPQLHAHTHSNRSHQSPPCPMQSQLA